MTYTKPDKVRYVDMAIWIDEHAYSDHYDENTMYQYLYHLSNMLAHQACYFNKSEDYDQFSLFSASRLYLRLNNPKQFEYTEQGSPKMEPIKSILNYIKKVLYPYKVDFEAEFNLNNEKDIQIISTGTFDLGSYLVDTASVYDQLGFSLSTYDLSKVIKTHLCKIPYKKNSPEWINIYLSCMLTLLDSITLSKHQTLRYNNSKRDKTELLEKIYAELRHNPPILYHLDKSMSNYISVLVNEIRHAIAAEFSWESDYYISAEHLMKTFLAETFKSEDS